MAIERSPPVSKQAAEMLRDRILEGHYPPGRRLPSENDLSGELGISRSSLREALNELEAAQLITRQQGVGTFVNDTKALLRMQLQGFRDIYDLLESMGHKPASETLPTSTRKPSKEEATLLGVGVEETILELTRNYFADDVMVMHCRYMMPASNLTRDVTEQDAELKLPELLAQLLNTRVAIIRTRVRAETCADALCEGFQVSPGTPILVVRDVFIDRDGEPILLSCIDFNDKVIDFYAFQYIE
jgi:GntR family transcriptional regulator